MFLFAEPSPQPLWFFFFLKEYFQSQVKYIFLSCEQVLMLSISLDVFICMNVAKNSWIGFEEKSLRNILGKYVCATTDLSY